jgi:hypothetical protein
MAPKGSHVNKLEVTMRLYRALKRRVDKLEAWALAQQKVQLMTGKELKALKAVIGQLGNR